MLRALDTFYNPILEPSQSGRDDQTANETAGPPTPMSIERGEPESKVTDVEEVEPTENIFSSNPELAAAMIDQVPESFEEEDEVEPRNFREAWDHPDPVKREKWRMAIRKEFKDMINREVWRKID